MKRECARRMNLVRNEVKFSHGATPNRALRASLPHRCATSDTILEYADDTVAVAGVVGLFVPVTVVGGGNNMGWINK